MPDEIITNLYTSGGEFETEDGKEYRGMYHRYLTNEIYTEANWDPRISKKLKPLIRKVNKDTPYADLKRNLKTSFLQPAGSPGRRLIASGHAFHRSTTMCFCEAELHDNDQLVAKALGTFKYLKRLDAANRI